MTGREILTAGRTFVTAEDDIFIVSYPRSGNTWLRFLLGGCIHGAHDITFETLQDYAPDIYIAEERAWRSVHSPRLIKSHEMYNPGYGRVVYCYRDVRDVMPSYYRYLKKVGHPKGRNFPKFFNGFINGLINPNLKIGDWKDNVEGWLNHLEAGCVIQYEDLLTDPTGVMIRVMRALGKDPDEDRVRDIVSHYTKSVMMNLEENYQGALDVGMNKDLSFVGGGVRDRWKELCDDDQERQLMDKYGDLLCRLGYEV